MKILVIDVGGTRVKAKLGDHDEIRRFLSGPAMTPQEMVEGVKKLTSDWQYDRVSIGFPGPVKRGKITREPVNLGHGWVNFDFSVFGKPVRLINDAAMQALGSYEGGTMLFLGLGTGLGTAMIHESIITPLEIGHLPYRKGRTYEEYLGEAGLRRLGKKKWRVAVDDVVSLFVRALNADYVVLGGGNVKKLRELPPGARLGANTNAFVGGVRLWQDGG
jgi:predicted NBD/HSP70 family sugar kinase